jgi:hypothetical protein
MLLNPYTNMRELEELLRDVPIHHVRKPEPLPVEEWVPFKLDYVHRKARPDGVAKLIAYHTR